jgi:hypothetical protein
MSGSVKPHPYESQVTAGTVLCDTLFDQTAGVAEANATDRIAWHYYNSKNHQHTHCHLKCDGCAALVNVAVTDMQETGLNVAVTDTAAASPEPQHTEVAAWVSTPPALTVS